MGKAQQNMNERRRFLRKLVTARVKLTHGTIGEIVARTRDISDSGVFVAIHPVPRLPVGAHIKMHMLDSSLPKVAFNMKVTRTVADGLGLMFVDFELDGIRYAMDTLKDQYKKQK